jgi:branched-chain amino acid aminotransferase
MIDGVLVPIEQATVSVLDRGFLYGDSVFETLRTYGGRAFALHEHLERLARSASLVHIAMPVSVEDLASEVDETISAAKNPESYIRVMVTRGAGELGLDPASATRPLRLVLVTPLVVPPLALYEAGIEAVAFRTERVGDGTAAAGAKLGNYLVSVLAVRAAKAAGAAEALIVDKGNHVIEGATSNVFFVDDRVLVTPAEDSGILAGITRRLVLEAARGLGLSVRFEAPTLDALPRFREVFITSSIRELLAVVRVDGAAVGAGVPGPVYKALLEAFRSRVRTLEPIS